MKSRFLVLIAMIAGLMTGCASTPPQQEVKFSTGSVSTPEVRVGVVMTALPKIDTQFPGAGCLLCYAAAAATNSTLTDYTRTLSYEDLPSMKDQVSAILVKKGGNVTIISGNIDVKALPDFDTKGPNIARKDFTSLRAKYNVDKLIVIDFAAIGILRPYSSYFPTSDPKANFNGVSYLVNLKNNTYEWYQPIFVAKSSDEKWDEPPKFPGLTNAYYQALELAKDSVLKPLAE